MGEYEDGPWGLARDHMRYEYEHQQFTVPRGGIQFPIPTASPGVTGFMHFTQEKDEETDMRTNDAILAEAQELRDKAELLEKIATEREKYGADPFKNGTVLKVDMKYRTSNRSYAYSVIKIAGRFYISGKMNGSEDNNGLSWDSFVAWLAQGDATVWQAGTLKRVY